MTILLNRIKIGAIPILLLLSSVALAEPIYVKHDATGKKDGTSWADAYTDLQTALTKTKSGEIWVAKGVYKPTTGTDRTATFQLTNGVALYGGFAGTEAKDARDQRNWDTNKTVLSGDIDNNDTVDADDIITDVNNIQGNNVYTVVTGSGTNETAVLDGFVITGGLADGNGDLSNPDRHGAGIFNNKGSPTLVNLIVTGNHAKGADNNGFGGGMYNRYSSNPTLTNVTFSSNATTGSGGGMYNFSSSNPTLTDVTFNSNTASETGGGMFNESSNPTLTDVTFIGNNTTSFGGGMFNNSSNPTLTDVTFSNNTAGSFGGGMFNDSSNPTLTDVTFSNNTAGSFGGGMLNISSSKPTLTNVTFNSNTASIDGGGMFNNGSSPRLTNVIFSSNTANDYGGGMYNDSSSPTLINVTLSGNFAQTQGGGIHNQTNETESTLTNVIVWGNTANVAPQIANSEGKLNISHSLIQGGCPSENTGVTCGSGNISFNPLFVDEPNGDLRLSLYSPAIDAGNKEGEGITLPDKDLAGNTRIYNDQVDIGAYEYDGSDLKPVGLKPTIAFFVERSGEKNPLNDIDDVGDNSIPTFANLDQDDDLEVFIGERDANTINYYQNTGTVLKPKFEEKTGTANPFNNMNIGYDSSPVLIDINKDGKLDLFVGSDRGTILYYKNTGPNNSPTFEVQNESNNPFDGVSVKLPSAPTFVDIDNDDDFDAFIGNGDGTLNYYENTGTGDSPTFIERLDNNNPLLDVDVGEYSKPTFVDLDRDGDFDAFIGGKAGLVHYYENTGTARQPYFVSQINPLMGFDIGERAAPTFVDWDQDGDQDAFIGKADGTINYYENLGPVTGKRFLNQADVFKGISVGKWSAPSLVDIDYDGGDLDAFIGEEAGIINYYKNTGTPNSPLFEPQIGSANPFAGVNIGSDSSLAFADIDADDDKDTFIGEINGTIKYYQNTGTATEPQFEEQNGAANPLSGVNLGTNGYSNPAFVDIDKDDDFDVFIGRRNGTIHYYQNQGTNQVPEFVEQTGKNNPFNNIDVGTSAIPTFIDFDEDGDFDAFVGEDDGIINYFENTGTAEKPQFVARTGHANPFMDVDIRRYSAPFLADIDNDRLLDALIGEWNGTIQHYEYATITNALPRGGSYNFAPQVYLKCVACDKFYYTLDGSEPTKSPTYSYNAPITISANQETTLKYISVSGDTTSEVTTEKYFIDTQAPSVTLTEPQSTESEKQAELASLSIIKGTATDTNGGIGVDYTEVQIIHEKPQDDNLYATQSGGFGPTPTWLTAIGTDDWLYDTSKVSFSAGNYTIKVRAFDKLENISEEVERRVGIAKGYTQLYLESSSSTILNQGELTLTGKLNRYPATSEDLSGLPMILTIKGPNETVRFNIKTVSETGQFKFEINKKDQDGKLIGKEGPFTQTDPYNFEEKYKNVEPIGIQYSFVEGAYSFEAEFAGTDKLVASESPAPVTVLVGQSAGYAILIQGKIQNEEGLAAHKKTTNRIYKTLRERGLEKDNIHYFNYQILNEENKEILHEITVNQKTETIEVKPPTLTEIENAFTDLQDKMESNPAPLYVIMINHGGYDGDFHIYSDNNEASDDTITPDTLAGWLNGLEEQLKNTNAIKKPRIVILGSCYSGSFISKLSPKPTFLTEEDAGRIIITSATAQEESYKGPQEPDGIPSGEYFMEEFFARLGKGDNFKQAFEFATEKTETFTRQGGNANTTNRFYDTAMQHPLLDDNGDCKGSNSISTGSNSASKGCNGEQIELPPDGQQAEQIFLGIGANYQTNFAGNPAEILSVSNTIYLNANQSVATLEATVNKASRVNSAPIDIRQPKIELNATGTDNSFQLAIPELSRIFMSCALSNQCAEEFDEFKEPGMYEAFYFVRDNKTKNISPVKRSVIYKDKAGNQPPESFELKYPNEKGETKDNKAPKTTLLFVWTPSSDTDGPVTYNLILAKDEGFNEIVYQQEELEIPMTYVDEAVGLTDQTTYYWKVEAVDPYGARTTSKETFSFTTNNTNAPPGIATIHVVGVLDYQPLSNASIEIWDEHSDPPGFVVLNHDLFQHQGHYHMQLPQGRRRIKIENEAEYVVNGEKKKYLPQEFEIDINQDTTALNVELMPKGGLPTQPGQLQFSTNATLLKEEQGEATILVERVEGSNNLVTVNYVVASGSATAGSDYTSTNSTLTWQDQEERAKVINLDIIDDQDYEGDETLTITLSDPTGGATLGEHSKITVTIEDDEAAPEPVPGVLQFSSGTYSATEGDSTLNLNVSRVGGSDGKVSVQYMVSGTAALKTDYTGGTGTLTWSDGDDSDKQLTLNLIDDQEVEETETLNLILFNPTGDATLGTLKEATLSIADNDEAGVAGTLQFNTATQAVNEGEAVTLTITRTHGTQGEVSVQYMATGDSTATSTDYSGGSGTLTWAAGDASDKSLTLQITDDQEAEDAETIELTLIAPTGGVALGNPIQATVTITDNDEAVAAGTLQFNTATQTVNEGEAVTLTVTRLHGTQGEVSVQYMATGQSTATGTDYTGGSGTLTWTDGDASEKSLTLQITDDQEVEDAETIQLTLMTPTGGAVLGNPTQTTVTITDNDVALDNQPVATPDPVVTPTPDPVIAPTPVVTPDPVVTTDPVIVEPDTSVPVTTPVIEPESESETEIAAEAGAEAGLSDSQTAILQFASTTYMAEESEGELHKITVTRTNSSTGEISVQYLTTVASTATYGKDFSGGNGSLTWADGETGAKSIMLTLFADNEVENVETVNLMLSNPTGPARLGPQPQTTLLITDPVVVIEHKPEAEESSTQNANAGVLQFFAPYYTINEGMIGDLTTFTVTRTEGDEGEVSVQYTILEEGTATPYQDYVGGIGTLVWQAGDNRPKPISVMVLDDNQIEEWETIPLVLFEPTGGAELGPIKQASLIIADNDQPENLDPSQAQPADPISEPESETSETTQPETEESTLTDDLEEEEKEPAQTAPQETALVFSDLPSLGNGMVVLDDGTILNAKILKNHFDTDIRFFGGAKTSGEEHHSFLTLSDARQVTIVGEIKIDPAHIDKTADILIVKTLSNQASNTLEQLLMFDNQGQILEWDGQLTSLLAAEKAVTLSATQMIAIYRGWLKPGRYQIYFGYRLTDDDLIFFNGEQPIQIDVKADDDQYVQKSPIIWQTAFSPDGRQIATASSDGHVSLWNANTGNRLARLQGHTDKVKSIAFSPDGQLLATASYDQTAKLWEIKTQQELGVLRGHQKPIEKIIFSPDGQQIATASDDKTARLWSVDTQQELAIFTGHQDGLKEVMFSHNGQQLVTTSWDQTARVWLIATGETITVLPHDDIIEQATFSPSDQQVVTTSWDQTAKLWHADTGQVIHTLNHPQGVAYATFSPDGEYLVTTAWDYNVRLWEANTGELVWTRGHQSSVNHAAFSPNGQQIITGAHDHTARLWETTTGKPLQTLIGHQGNVWQVGFSPDGQRVISASWDNTVRVWEVESGEMVMVLKD